MEDGEIHFPDGADVANQAVGHTAQGAAAARRRAQQFAPGCDAQGRSVASEHRDVAWLQVVDERNLRLIGIFAFMDGIGIHIDARAGTPEQRHVLVEGADEGPHRLVFVPELVEQVGEHRRIQNVLECSHIDTHEEPFPSRELVDYGRRGAGRPIFRLPTNIPRRRESRCR